MRYSSRNFTELALILSFLITSCKHPNEPPPDPPEYTHKIKVLQEDFDLRYSRAQTDYETRSKSGDARGNYQTDFVINALLNMYEGTEEEEYIEQALGLALNMVNTAQDFPYCMQREEEGPEEGEGSPAERCAPLNPYKDNHLDWARSGFGKPVFLNDTKAFQNVPRLIRIIIGNSNLNSKFGESASKLLDFIDKEILTKWIITRKRTYLKGPSMGLIISDKQVMIGRIAFDLYQAGATSIKSNGKNWLDVAREIAENFRHYMVFQNGKNETLLENGSILWDIGAYNWWAPNMANPTAPDTFHATRHIEFVIEMYEEDFVFDQSYVEGLTKTFTHNIWNGVETFEEEEARKGYSGNTVWFTVYITGEEAPYGGPGANTLIIDECHNEEKGWGTNLGTGYCRLGQYNADAHRACNALYEFITEYDGRENLPCGKENNYINALHQLVSSNYASTIRLISVLAKNLRYKVMNERD